jgi:hypothetical protein
VTEEQTKQVQEALEEMDGDLYWRLHSLSKVLESSGVIDESRHKDAYATILDAMNFVRAQSKSYELIGFQERQKGLNGFSRWYPCPEGVVVPKEMEESVNGMVFQWRPIYIKES